MSLRSFAYLRVADYALVEPPLPLQPNTLARSKLILLDEKSPSWALSVTTKGVEGPITALIFILLSAPILIYAGLFFVRRKLENPERSLDERYRTFHRRFHLIMFGPLLVSLLVAVWVLATNQIGPIIDLWTGSRHSPTFILLLPVPFLLCLPAIFQIGKVEANLAKELAGAEPSADCTEVIKKPDVPKGYKYAVIGAALLAYIVTFASSLDGDRKLPLSIVGHLLVFGSDPISRLLHKLFDRSAAEPENPQLGISDINLLHRATQIAAKYGVTIDTFIISEDMNGSVEVSFYNGTLLMTRRSERDLTSAELDFGLAHAMAKRQEGMTTPWTYALVGAVLCLVILGASILYVAPPYRLVGMLAPMIVILPAFFWLTTWMEDRKMVLALELYPDEEAARSYFVKVRASSPLRMGKPDVWEEFLKRRKRKNPSPA